jgi:hypothetical protein
MAGGESKQPKQDEPGWEYKPAGGEVPQAADVSAPDKAAHGSGETVEWTASEFIAHDKSFGWYALFSLAAIALASLLYLLTRDVVSTVGVSIMAIILIVVAGRKPRVLSYRLDGSGLKAGARFHSYGEYKSFAVINEGPFWSLVLLPLKRFSLPQSLYLAPDQEEEIVKVLGDHLPLEQRELGWTDQLMRKIRF